MDWLDSVSQYLTNTLPGYVRSGIGYAQQGINNATQRIGQVADYMKPEPIRITGGSNIQDLSYLADQNFWNQIDQKAAQQPQVMGQQAPQQNFAQFPDSPIAGYINDQAASPANPDAISFLENSVFPVTDQYGIPREVVAGQWAAEGRFGVGNPYQNNMWNLMYGGQVHPYQTFENAVRDYDLTLKDIMSSNLGASKDDFNYSNYDPETLLRALQMLSSGEASSKRFEGHSPTPEEYINLIQSTPEWRYYRQ